MMKKTLIFIFFVIFINLTIQSIEFDIDLSIQKSNHFKNVYDTIITWYSSNDWGLDSTRQLPKNYIKLKYPFINFVEIFTATGGCYIGYPECTTNRDLLNDPKDITKGYNYSTLIRVIENIVRQGLGVYIVTGNVPIAFSSNPKIGVFGVNMEPPDDWNEYFEYIKGLGNKLVEVFGIDLVRKWKFGVLTEFNNYDWWSSKNDYFKLYDFTVAALQEVIGETFLNIGSHACTQCTGNGWDPIEFVDHVVNGINYYTGLKGTRITFLTDSFYETAPGNHGTLETFDKEIQKLVKKAESLGLNVKYGIDEGRILFGPEGSKYSLGGREVGNSYQASFDALFFHKLFLNNFDFYARWNTNSNGLFGDAVDCIAANVARLCYKMKDSIELQVQKKKSFHHYGKQIFNVLSGYKKENNSIHIIAYNHYPQLNGGKDLNFDIKIKNVFGNYSMITQWKVDDHHSQFWNQWWDDMNNQNITKFSQGWSKYSSNIQTLLIDPKDRQYFYERLDVYRTLAELKPEQPTRVEIKNKEINFRLNMISHSVIYCEKQEIKRKKQVYFE